LGFIQNDARASPAFFHWLWMVPAHVPMVECAGVSLAVKDEDELLSLGVLEVGVIAAGNVPVDAGRLTARGGLLVADVEEVMAVHWVLQLKIGRLSLDDFLQELPLVCHFGHLAVVFSYPLWMHRTLI